jgi:hypothetical protein
MKRAAVAKSCGSTVSARSRTAGAIDASTHCRESRNPRAERKTPGRRGGDHKFVCAGQQYWLTGQGHELRQYRRDNSALLVKYF